MFSSRGSCSINRAMMTLSDFAEKIRESDEIVVFTGAGSARNPAFRIFAVPAVSGRVTGRSRFKNT